MPDIADAVMAGIIGEIILDEEADVQIEQEADLFHEPYPGEEESW